jgi:hypothetical protein
VNYSISTNIKKRKKKLRISYVVEAKKKKKGAESRRWRLREGEAGSSGDWANM